MLFPSEKLCLVSSSVVEQFNDFVLESLLVAASVPIDAPDLVKD